MSDPLAGRAALVTGAASGIGRAIAERLADAGMDVLSVDLAPDEAGPGIPFAGRPDARRRQPGRGRRGARAVRRLDVVVANAGIQHVAPIAEFPVERWQTIVSTAADEPVPARQVRLAGACASSGDGRFIVIASAHALVASPYKAAYVSAKHGVLGLVKTLALEGARRRDHRDRGVPGLCAHAAGGEADRRPGAGARAARGARCSEQVILAPHAVKRLIEPDEVAGVVAFLAGPARQRVHRRAGDDGQGWTAR